MSQFAIINVRCYSNIIFVTNFAPCLSLRHVKSPVMIKCAARNAVMA